MILTTYLHAPVPDCTSPGVERDRGQRCKQVRHPSHGLFPCLQDDETLNPFWLLCFCPTCISFLFPLFYLSLFLDFTTNNCNNDDLMVIKSLDVLLVGRPPHAAAITALIRDFEQVNKCRVIYAAEKSSRYAQRTHGPTPCMTDVMTCCTFACRKSAAQLSPDLGHLTVSRW